MNFKSHKANGSSIVVSTLSGRLDLLNSKQLQKKFDTWMKKTNLFVFECSTLDFIDSSGLGAVVSCLRKAEDSGGSVRLASITPKIRMIFEVTGAEKLFSLYNTEDDAVASFTQ